MGHGKRWGSDVARRKYVGTDAHEVMEILSGELEVLLPGSADWKPVSGGDSFEVPANSKFQVKIHAMINYCCSYG